MRVPTHPDPLNPRNTADFRISLLPDLLFPHACISSSASAGATQPPLFFLNPIFGTSSAEHQTQSTDFPIPGASLLETNRFGTPTRRPMHRASARIISSDVSLSLSSVVRPWSVIWTRGLPSVLGPSSPSPRNHGCPIFRPYSAWLQATPPRVHLSWNGPTPPTLALDHIIEVD